MVFILIAAVLILYFCLPRSEKRASSASFREAQIFNTDGTPLAAGGMLDIHGKPNLW
jgi:hypothetical protein